MASKTRLLLCGLMTEQMKIFILTAAFQSSQGKEKSPATFFFPPASCYAHSSAIGRGKSGQSGWVRTAGPWAWTTNSNVTPAER